MQRFGIGLAGAMLVVLAACGSADPHDGAGANAGAVATPGLPSEYTGPDGVTSTVTSADRIVTLSGEFSEIVDALGLSDNLVGVDLSSDHPPDVMASKPKVGVEFRLFAEPILALDPTVVLGDIDATPPEVIEQVRDAGVPVVIMPRLVGLTAPAEKIRLVGEVLGVDDLADAVATEVQERIDSAVAPVETTTSHPRVVVVYVATEDQVLLLGDNTVFEGLIEAVGAVDVAPAAGTDGFVPLSAEAIASAAPDVIITARRGFDRRGGLDGFLELPGLAQTPAGRSGAVLVYDDSLLLTLGPRTGELLERLMADLHPELGSGS
jgi:iron complex transport system substrate-binding protein